MKSDVEMPRPIPGPKWEEFLMVLEESRSIFSTKGTSSSGAKYGLVGRNNLGKEIAHRRSTVPVTVEMGVSRRSLVRMRFAIGENQLRAEYPLL